MNGLDPAGMLEMREMIQSLVAEGRTVVLSSHLLDEVERTCDAVAIVDRGRVIRQGSIVELLAGASVKVESTAPSRIERSRSSQARHSPPTSRHERMVWTSPSLPGRIEGPRRRSIVSSSKAGSPSIGSKRSTPRSSHGSSRSRAASGPSSDDS